MKTDTFQSKLIHAIAVSKNTTSVTRSLTSKYDVFYRPKQHKGKNPLHNKRENTDNGKNDRMKHRYSTVKDGLRIGKQSCKQKAITQQNTV